MIMCEIIIININEIMIILLMCVNIIIVCINENNINNIIINV